MEDDHTTTARATPAFEETARRRADLHAALVSVERAAARPAPGREQEWVAEVVGALDELEHEIEEHIEVTEGADGLYDEIAAIAPRLLTTIDTLRRDHPVMLARARELRARLASAPPGDALPADELRDEAQRLLGFLVKHRQRGADLVWEAYNLDIGGVG